MKAVSTSSAPAAIGPYSQGVVVNGILYSSGQIALDPGTGVLVGETIEEQAHQVLKNLGAVLEAAGSDFNHVIKTTCFMADMADFAAMNQIYAEYFTGIKPARSAVAVKQLPKGALLEIELIAEVI